MLSKDNKNRMPNLIIAGVQKGGTTWLHNMLKSHPEIFMTEQKELGFFNQTQEKVIADFASYLEHFSSAQDERILGESTPHYFWKKEVRPLFGPKRNNDQDTAELINQYLSEETKIIVMLRDPVSRAISAYHHHYAMGRNAELRTVFDCEPNWGVIDLGFYRRHMTHWNSVFGDRIRYWLFDDISERPLELLREIFSWLGTSCNDSILSQIDVGRKINTRDNILTRHSPDAEKDDFPKLNIQEISALSLIFRPDVRFVEEHLQKNLSHWKNTFALIEKNKKYIQSD